MFGFGGGVSFDASRDIPDLSGKVALVTGGNSGLGAETVKELASHNCSTIYLAARTRKTAESVVSSIKSTVPNANIIILELDLSSFDSIKTCVSTLLAQTSRLDLLICNAGVAFNSPGLNQSGYETQFGINHMGHALLIKLLLPLMIETAKKPGADVRNVIVNSDAHNLFALSGGIGIDLEAIKTDGSKYMTHKRYGMSKLAGVYLSKELAQRYPSVKTICVHPGAVFTDIGRGLEQGHPWLVALMKPVGRMLFKTVQQGAQNQLWAATAGEVVSGEYYNPVGKAGGASKQACDEQSAKALWEWTEKELEGKGFGVWP